MTDMHPSSPQRTVNISNTNVETTDKWTSKLYKHNRLTQQLECMCLLCVKGAAPLSPHYEDNSYAGHSMNKSVNKEGGEGGRGEGGREEGGRVRRRRRGRVRRRRRRWWRRSIQSYRCLFLVLSMDFYVCTMWCESCLKACSWILF